MIPVWLRFVGVIVCLATCGTAFIVCNDYSLFLGKPGGRSMWFRPKHFKCPTCGYDHEPFAPHGRRDDDADDKDSWQTPPRTP